ncbi:MAG: ribosome recycling factor [Eubacteriales bacterium]|nr:ribosome recycling factor [Eubacteriales bacterium]
MVDLKDYYQKLQKCFEAFQNEMGTVRAGRANPKILDKIMVDYYGQKTPLPQVGSISIPEARIILIQPWDKTIIKEIEKAINMADIGINPTSDGISVRLIFPELTEERRKELTKEIKKMGENYKVSIRTIRKECMDFIKKSEKDGNCTEDEVKRLNDEVQKKIDDFVSKIDKEVEEKNKEIMKV